MSMRPIDIQTIIPKVQSQHNAKEVVVNKEANNLQNAQLKNMEETEKKLVKISKNERKEHGRVGKDGDKNNLDGKKKKKRFFLKKDKDKDNEKDEEEKNHKSLRRNHFDMKI